MKNILSILPTVIFSIIFWQVAMEPMSALAAPSIGSTLVAPSEKDGLAARLTDKGVGELENDFLRIVFQPEDGGSVGSIIDKKTGKELAVCDSYDKAVYRAFKEVLPGMGISEGKSGPEAAPYKLTELRVEKDRAVAVFEGHPYKPETSFRDKPLAETTIPDGVTDPDAAYGKVRVIKTYTLARGESRIGVRLQAFNDGDQSIPLALFCISGLRVEGESVDVLAPTAQGVKSDFDGWSKHGSSFLIIPQAAGGWVGMAARNDARQTAWIAGRPGQFDSITTWEAKFNGATLAFATPLSDIQPGKFLDVPYSFVVARGISRLDTASPDMACGIIFDEAAVKPGAELPVRVEVASPRAAKATVRLGIRRATESVDRSLKEASLEIPTGEGAAADFKVALGSEGIFVLTAEITTDDGRKLTAQRAVELGVTTDQFAHPLPKMEGKRFYSKRLFERPIPPHITRLTRDVNYPMIPWSNPSAGERIRTLLVSEGDWTVGSLRELVRRGDLDWDRQVLYGKDVYGGGEYRDIEQAELEKKLEEMKPRCLVAASVRFEALRRDVLTHMLARVKDGMGLVLFGCKIDKVMAWPPSFLRDPLFQKEEIDLDGPLASVLRSPVANDKNSRAVAYRYGKGRIICYEGLRLNYFRDLLVPNLSGTTELPEEEYYYARYLKAIRYVAGANPTTRVLDVRTDGQLLVVDVKCMKANAALYAKLVSTDLSEQIGIMSPIRIQPGKQTVKLTPPAKHLPSGDYVAHVWLLEDGVGADNLDLRRSAPMPQKVFDFSAAFFTLDSGIRIAKLEAADARQAVPKSVTVEVASSDIQGVSLQGELYNSPGRLVWRGSVSPGADGKGTFKDFGVEPVSPEGMFHITAKRPDGACAVASLRLGQRELFQPIRTDDVNYLTSAGVHWHLAAFRLVAPWAREKARINFTQWQGEFYSSFPWVRKGDNTTSPPMADQEVMRKAIREALQKGDNMILFGDEFKIEDEYDYSPATLAAFAEHQAVAYGTIEKLNAAWGTDFKTFAEARPLLLPEARKTQDRPARWLDFRLFMDRLINGRYRIALEEAGKFDPPKRMGESGLYAPGYKIGTHHYEYARNSRLIATYPGIRAEWARAFATEDTLIQVWRGYGGQQPVDPWIYLFGGFHGIDWWGFMPSGDAQNKGIYANMAMVAIDATPAPRFPEVAIQQTEISQGLGKLLLAEKLSEPMAFVPYSQASVYFGEFHGQDRVADWGRACGLLRSLGIPYSHLADEQVADGKLKGMKGRLLVLAGVDSCPTATADGYARAVDAGCTLLADGPALLHDVHGNRFSVSPLDVHMGIDRRNATTIADAPEEAVIWTDAAPESLRTLKLRLKPMLLGVKIVGARVWARFSDGSPAVAASPVPGRSLWINSRIENAPEFQAVAAESLRTMRLVAPVTVEPAGILQPSVAVFGRGEARYYGLLADKNGGRIKIRFPKKAHTYDVRSGKYHGQTDMVELDADPARLAQVFAQLPYQVNGLDLTVKPKSAKPGETLTIAGRVLVTGGKPGIHVVHLSVKRPNDIEPLIYEQNLRADAEGAFTARIPLALNDPSGRWTIRCCDVSTGQAAEFFLRMEP